MRYRFLLLLPLLIPLFALVQSRPKQETATQQESNKAQNVPSVVPAQPSSQQQQGQTENSCEIPSFTDGFWSNWSLVLIGIVTAWIALGTLGDIKTQTIAAKISAEAAKKSAEIAEMSLKLAERADILLNSCGLKSVQGDGPSHRVIVEYKNFGRTRAKDVKFTLNLIIEGVPETDSGLIPLVTVGAGETKSISSQRFGDFLSVQTANALFSRKIPLRFESEVTYKDVFDTPHAAKYVGTYNWDTGVFRIDNQNTD